MVRMSVSFCAVAVLLLTGCSTSQNPAADGGIAPPVQIKASSLVVGDDLGFSLRHSDAALAAVQDSD